MTSERQPRIDDPSQVLEGEIIGGDSPTGHTQTGNYYKPTRNKALGRLVMSWMVTAVAAGAIVGIGTRGDNNNPEEAKLQKPIVSADMTIEPGGSVIGSAEKVIAQIVKEAVDKGDIETAQLAQGITKDELNRAGQEAAPNVADVQPGDIYTVHISPDGKITITKLEN